MKTCAIVENICVYGDSSKQFTVGLVVPNPKHLVELAIKQGVTETDFEKLCAMPVMEKAVIKELAEHARKCKYSFPISIFFPFSNRNLNFPIFRLRQIAKIRSARRCNTMQRGLVTGHGFGNGRIQIETKRHSGSLSARHQSHVCVMR